MNSNKGISLIEVLVALGVFSVSFSAIVFLSLDALQSSSYNLEYTRATYFAYEGIEATRSIAADDFNRVTPGIHGLVSEDGEWNWSGTVDEYDGFVRRVTVVDLDADTKEITSEVDWEESRLRGESVYITQRMTNWYRNVGTSTATSTP